MRRAAAGLALLAATALAAGCGGSSGSSGSGGGSGAPVNGGTLRAGIPDNPDYLDPGLSYTNEGWEILEATNNGLVTFKKAAGGAGAQIVPDIASAMPTVTDGGRTYTFHVRPGVMFSPPVSRAVKPSDFKFSIERLFRVDSGGLGLLHRHPGRECLRQEPQGRHLGDRRQRRQGHDHVPPDPARRHLPRLHGDAVRLRAPHGHAVEGHLDAAAVADRDRALPDLELHAQAAARHDAQPELQASGRRTRPTGT